MAIDTSKIQDTDWLACTDDDGVTKKVSGSLFKQLFSPLSVSLVTYTINNPGGTFTLRANAPDINNTNLAIDEYTVDWGDGSPTETSTEGSLPHTYSAGNYTIQINSTGFYRPFFGDSNYDQNQLLTVEMADGTKVGTTLQRAFISNSSNITSYTIPFSVTSGVENIKECFQGFQGSTFPLIDTSSVTNMTNAWYNCPNLTSLDIDTSAVVGNGMSGTFNNCNLDDNSLNSIDISQCTDLSYTFGGNRFTYAKDLDYSNVTVFTSTWTGCGSLTTVPDIDYSNVTNIQSAWYYCNLSTFQSDANFSNLLTASYAWMGNNFTTFPALDFPVCTDLSYAWAFNPLTSFAIGAHSNVSNFSNSWDGCSQLTSFPDIGFSNVTDLSGAWKNCSNLTSFPAIDTSQVISLNSTWTGCGLTTFPFINTSKCTDFTGIWNSCQIANPPLIDMSKGSQMYLMFFQNSALVTLPPYDFSSSTIFQQAFSNCTNLANIPPNLFDTTGDLYTVAFNLAFSNCALTAASIENLLVSMDTNGRTGIKLSIQQGTNAAKSTWTTAANTAYTNLINKGWTIEFNP